MGFEQRLGAALAVAVCSDLWGKKYELPTACNFLPIFHFILLPNCMGGDMFPTFGDEIRREYCVGICGYGWTLCIIITLNFKESIHYVLNNRCNDFIPLSFTLDFKL